MSMLLRPSLVFCLFAFVAEPCLAQKSAVAGVFAGYSSSSVREGRAGPHGSRSALTAGLSLRSRLSDRLSLSGNLLYAAKGFTENEPLIQYSFLELPVLVQYEFKSPGAKIQPYAGAGLAVAMRLSCRRSFVGVNGPHEDGCGQAQASNLTLPGLRSHDIGQDFRLGLRVAGFGGAVIVEGRHVRGMVGPDPTRGRRNRMTALTLGYEFKRRAAAAHQAPPAPR